MEGGEYALGAGSPGGGGFEIPGNRSRTFPAPQSAGTVAAAGGAPLAGNSGYLKSGMTSSAIRPISRLSAATSPEFSASTKCSTPAAA